MVSRLCVATAVMTAALTSIVPVGASAASATSPVLSCAELGALTLPHAIILSATEVTATTGNYCNVIGVIDKRVSAQDPDHFTYGIGFELNLPDQWVGRFEMKGGAGNDGSVASPTGQGGVELGLGWAVAADDGGHEDAINPAFGWSDDDAATGGTDHFGIDEQARLGYGYTGIERTTRISKEIIAHYYGRKTQYSYIYGCSNGGRDAMMASQRYPDLFDGVLAANPGFDLPRAAVGEAWNEQALAPLATRTDANSQPYLPDTFPPGDLEVASAAILQACDGLDGLVDGIVDDFPACTDRLVYPALDDFTCSPTGIHGNTPHGGTCLTAGQVAALKKIYRGARDDQGNHFYTGWYWDAGIWTPASASGLGFTIWNVGSPPASGPLVNSAFNLTLGAGSLAMVFTTPPVVTPVAGPSGQEAFVFHYDFNTQPSKIFATAPGYGQSSMQFMAAVAEDMSPFVHHGGKLIITASVDDAIFSGVDIVHWYQGLAARDPAAHNFARLFMVPNMAHCGGGPATNVFAVNALNAITDWVENDVAPDRIVAANANTSSPFPSGGIFDPRVAQNFPTGGTRPLCPYPRQSRYLGSGATNDAANFACVIPSGPGSDDDH
jgi:hypothetical protein